MRELPILSTPDLATAIIELRKTETRRLTGLDEINKDPDRYDAVLFARDGSGDVKFGKEVGGRIFQGMSEWIKCPYGVTGDLLYVRESWKPISYHHEFGWEIEFKDGDIVEFDCLFDEVEKEVDLVDRVIGLLESKGIDPESFPQEEVMEVMPWKPNIHLPKLGSRIWLRVKEIKVERVQDITTEGIKAEGVQIPVHNGKPLIPLTDKYFPHGIIDIENPSKENLFHAFWVQLWDSINESRGYGSHKNPWVWVVKFEVVSTDGRPG